MRTCTVIAALVAATLVAAVPPAEAGDGRFRFEERIEHRHRDFDRRDFRDRREFRHRHDFRDRHGFRQRHDFFDRHEHRHWKRGYWRDGWERGYWHHGWRGGHRGWWWVAGDRWYLYPRPVYPYPYLEPSVIIQLPPLIIH